MVDAISYSVEDPLGALRVGKDTHRSGPPPYLAEIPLQDVGSADLFQSSLGKA